MKTMTLGQLKKQVDEALKTVTEDTPVYCGQGDTTGPTAATEAWFDRIRHAGETVTVFLIEVDWAE